MVETGDGFLIESLPGPQVWLVRRDLAQDKERVSGEGACFGSMWAGPILEAKGYQRDGQQP